MLSAWLIAFGFKSFKICKIVMKDVQFSMEKVYIG